MPPSDTPAILAKLQANLERVLLGKTDVIRLALTALLAEGHLLIEDVPGIGKTLLAKAMARSLTCSFHRIQCTPDLLPSDLIGTSVYHQPTGEFRFHPGPLFAQVVLADEINRATPRTQSALLEAMSEQQVTLDGKLSDYLLNILERTRTTPDVSLGASPRAGLALYRAAQAWALVHGRSYVIPDDVKRLAVPVLAHRLLMRSSRHGNHFEAATHY